MAKQMVTIDGSLGEGGGQILRTSLSLSMVTQKPIRITAIRAKREKPGLMRQHLTAVNAAAAVCGATVDGAAIGSRELTFSPGPVQAGSYTFAIGTAGSTTLVFQTVLPALLLADGPSSLTLEGGTHNTHAPPLTFIEEAFVPLINRMGAKVHVTMERVGFYPAGGGRWFANIEPVKQLAPLHLRERGEVVRRIATAYVAALPGDIAKRELTRVEKLLNWTEDERHIRRWPDEWGPGNVLMLQIQSQHVTEVFSGFGMKGVTAEAVGDNTSRDALKYLAAGVPVGEWLADQLLLPMALAGDGSFVTMNPTRHTMTNIEVIGKFLEVGVTVSELEDGKTLIEVGRA